ncbi:MAG: hypothetical protein FJ385_00200 [Verrucomicrobia bacterium]|nr:hypothetical protein [Verrucomicrobiota bacterium]
MLDWHILVGMAGVSIASILYPLISGLTMGDGESSARIGAGCFLVIVGGPLIQAIAVSGFVLLCLPAIIGGGGFTPGEVIGPLFWPVFKAGFLAMLLVLVLCFIPIVGRMISDTPGVPVFLQGIFMLKPIAKKLYYAITDGSRLPDSAFPSFWDCLGYILIGLALCWAAFMCVAMIADQVKKRRDPVGHLLDRYRQEPSSGMMLVGMFVGPVLGVVPLLMYGQFIGLSIRSLQ